MARPKKKNAKKKAAQPKAEDLVWYVSYGSNLSERRFDCYLRGGTPPGGAVRVPGCDDPSPARENKVFRLPHRMYFASRSAVWGGAIAYLDHEEVDPDSPDAAYGRAWLITRRQFEQVVAQETGRPPKDAPDLATIDLRESGTLQIGEGKYDLVRSYGAVEGYPMVTCTNPKGIADTKDVTLGEPSAPYVWTIAAGLRDGAGLSDAEIVAYLQHRPGADTIGEDDLAAWVAQPTAEAATYLQTTGKPADPEWSPAQTAAETRAYKAKHAPKPTISYYSDPTTMWGPNSTSAKLEPLTRPSVTQRPLWDTDAELTPRQKPWETFMPGTDLYRAAVFDDVADATGYSVEELEDMCLPSDWTPDEVIAYIEDGVDPLVEPDLDDLDDDGYDDMFVGENFVHWSDEPASRDEDTFPSVTSAANPQPGQVPTWWGGSPAMMSSCLDAYRDAAKRTGMTMRDIYDQGFPFRWDADRLVAGINTLRDMSNLYGREVSFKDDATVRNEVEIAVEAAMNRAVEPATTAGDETLDLAADQAAKARKKKADEPARHDGWVSPYKRRNSRTGQVETVGGYKRR